MDFSEQRTRPNLGAEWADSVFPTFAGVGRSLSENLDEFVLASTAAASTAAAEASSAVNEHGAAVAAAVADLRALWDDTFLDDTEDTAKALGLFGALVVEGTALPTAEILAPVLQLALERALAWPQPLRVHAYNVGSLGHFRYAVVPSDPNDASAVAARIRTEAAHGGAARLLPELITLLDDCAPDCRHCRVRLTYLGHGGGSASRPRTRTPSPAAPSEMAVRMGGASEPMRTRSPSPTAANLEADPELKRRVMGWSSPT